MRGRFSEHRERGASLLILTFALFLVILPLVGLAIDGTTLYLVRIKLSQAVDAGALGGARSLNTGMDLTSQAGSATSTAQSYVYANFPNGYMGATYAAGSPGISVNQTSNMFRTVQVQASVTVPLTFMRVAGFANSTVAAMGQSTRRDVNVMLALDRSSSMVNMCGTMTANAQAFVNNFAEGRDIVGLISFTQAWKLDFPPGSDFKSRTPNLVTVLGGLQCEGNTSSAMSLMEAYNSIKAVNQPGRLNVIVFFTDGRPNGVTATFPVKGAADTRYVYKNGTLSLSASPASSCKKGVTLQGVIAQWGGAIDPGVTAGIFDPQSGNTISNAANCAINADQRSMTSDVAYIPTADSYANATTGYETSTLFSTGPYTNQIRPDLPTSIVAASTNAADNAAKKIRSDTTYNIVIYTLGLDGNDPVPLDQDFLRRIANDPQSSSYDSTRPAGHFYYAANITQLNAAYQAVASQILRLSR